MRIGKDGAEFHAIKMYHIHTMYIRTYKENINQRQKKSLATN